MDRRIESLRRQLETHRKNLSRLEERKAKSGIDAPISLLNQIDDEKEAIAELEKKIEEIRGDLEVERESDRAQPQPRRPFAGKSRAKPLAVIAAMIALVVTFVYLLWALKRSDVFDMWKAVLAIVVGIALDVMANYIYDLLRDRRWLPDSSSLKGVLLVFLFFIPLALLTLLSQSDIAPPDANRNPLIKNISVNPQIIEVGQKATITVNAVDPDNDPLIYVWTVSNGKIVEGPSQQSMVTYEAPDIPGDVVLRVIARDDKGGETEQKRNISIVVPSTAP
jgi:hypothetical protein